MKDSDYRSTVQVYLVCAPRYPRITVATYSLTHQRSTTCFRVRHSNIVKLHGRWQHLARISSGAVSEKSAGDSEASTRKVSLVSLVYWGLTPQQHPGSYQGGEMMMMKSVIWWRKPEYPEETTDLWHVTDETFHTYGLCPVRGLNLGRRGVKQSELRRDESGALAHRVTVLSVWVYYICTNLYV